ncbi:MAG: fructosamine kinase family protein [Acidimicrobiia bacterium]|nr:fructosamine kinase family protein [Acidimicrobiia bacterium]
MDVLREVLSVDLGSAVVDMTRLGGGDMAEAFAVDLADGRRVFAKTHRAPPEGFFSREGVDLRWLGDAHALAVPQVLAVSDESPARLVLEWISPGLRGASDEASFGRGLASLHKCGAEVFGRTDARTTGSQALPNDRCATWIEFFSERRLRPLARLAADRSALSGRTIAGLEDVADRLEDLGGPAEPPARLHGDLWAGNRMVDERGASWLIDPAAHGGHREFDLAMMRLFGGFADAAFAAYDEAYPLADGWEDRIGLHQLAPLVVHAIKFGGGYAAAVDDALRRLR